VIADVHTLRNGVAALVAADHDFERLYRRNGVPPLWKREPGYATLLLIILEQQVSLASARAAYARLETELGVVTPEAFLGLDDATLRAVGFSRQKAGYGRGLAAALLAGEVDLTRLADADDSTARAELMAIRGIGPWTADVYLLFVLGRQDAWPTGDRALQVSLGRLKAFDGVPDPATTDRVAEAWRPWRSVAARMLWHDYLGGPEYRER
jgi:DNA-3-methyladenine glycosylase II